MEITCTNCGKTKNAVAFSTCPEKANGRQSWCRVCVRVGMSQYRRTDRYARKIREYLKRPGIRARRRVSERKYANSPGGQAQRRAHRKTVRGRLQHCKRQAKVKARHHILNRNWKCAAHQLRRAAEIREALEGID